MVGDAQGLVRVQLAWVNREGSPVIEAYELPEGSTVGELIGLSRIAERRAELDPGPRRVALYGRLVSLATRLETGDRVELAPPLVADPMASRRRRAAVKAASRFQKP
jgi:putative ubiquitin-RnfH superfamily antitoxin RatB of RatAB toxin-antitoxin module